MGREAEIGVMPLHAQAGQKKLERHGRELPQELRENTFQLR